MKFCRPLLVCLFSIFLSSGLSAQNLFTEKINVCSKAKFCMDCGVPKADCEELTLDYISFKINHRYNFKNGFGNILFQVLVDSTGFSCVLSHNDVTHSTLSDDLIRFLNGVRWTPAIVKGKPVNASVNVMFTIAYGNITGKMQRVDLSELIPPGNPSVFNTQYQYNNPTLPKYDLTVYTKYNSPLPDNVGLACVVDKTDIVWYATANGLTRYDGNNFYEANEGNSPFKPKTAIHAITVDKNNQKWMYANKAVYMNNDKGWQVFDSTHMAIPGAYNIISNPTGEIFFTNYKGLMIIRNDRMRLIDKQTLPDLPSNNVFYAYFDNQERLWIGTFGGSIMIDKKQKVTVFNNTDTPLKDVCIADITEDEKGNMYFALKAYKDLAVDNEEEGIAVLSADGKWTHYNDKNSGMPANHVNNLYYDKFEHLLWIGTQQAGLVRFDLKDGWENYNNANSAMPGFNIAQIAQDSKGVVYAATANGMVIISKK